MEHIEELRLWLAVTERCAIPENGQSLSEAEKQALAQSCRVLAQNAKLMADKVAA